MPATLRHEHDNVYRLDVQGRLAKAELDRVQDELLAAMTVSRQRASRLLVLLDLFQGWVDDAGWNDLSFFITHGDRIERVALVGDEKWRDEMMMFTAAGLRKAPVKYFASASADLAREWIAAPSS